MPKDLADCTNDGCGSRAPVLDGTAVKIVVSTYLQDLSPWTTKSRGTSFSIPVVPVISISSLMISRSMMEDMGLRKNDHGCRVDDERRDIEDPRGALLDSKGKEEMLRMLMWDKEDAANISSGFEKGMITVPKTPSIPIFILLIQKRSSPMLFAVRLITARDGSLDFDNCLQQAHAKPQIPALIHTIREGQYALVFGWD